MAAILNQSVRIFGQANFTWPPFVIGETVQINLSCIDPASGNPLNLSSPAASVFWTMSNPQSGATLISRQATITNASAGLCYVPIASGDTAPSPTPLASGTYNVDCWVEETGGSGNRLDLAFGTVFLAPAYRLPNATVNPLPPQIPLGFVFVKRVAFSAVAEVAVTWPDFGVPVYVQVGGAVTDSTDGIELQAVNATVTSAGCTIQASTSFTGYCLISVFAQSVVN